MKNKKGTVLLWISMFGLITALAIFFAMTVKQEESAAYKGKQQLEMIQIYTEAEKGLFYIDQSAKYAVEKAKREDKENLEKNIKKNLAPYLASNPYGNLKLSVDDYDLKILEKNIIGTPKKYLPFLTPIPDRIEYYAIPSFNIPIES